LTQCELILTGQWIRVTRLPSENELTAELSVSPMTVRQALDTAVAEHLLVRIAGRGTSTWREKPASLPTS
jgi:DNA-binding GntR family transcriptional regulator